MAFFLPFPFPGTQKKNKKKTPSTGHQSAQSQRVHKCLACCFTCALWSWALSLRSRTLGRSDVKLAMDTERRSTAVAPRKAKRVVGSAVPQAAGNARGTQRREETVWVHFREERQHARSATRRTRVVEGAGGLVVLLGLPHDILGLCVVANGPKPTPAINDKVETLTPIDVCVCLITLPAPALPAAHKTPARRGSTPPSGARAAPAAPPTASPAAGGSVRGWVALLIFIHGVGASIRFPWEPVHHLPRRNRSRSASPRP